MTVAAPAPEGVIVGHGTAPLGGAVRFTRAQYYAISEYLDPEGRFELLDGIIYALSPAKPPHAGTVTFFLNRLAVLVPSYMLRSQDVLEIRPEGEPQPDVAVVTPSEDFYSSRHPNGDDAQLVIEVGDTERNPREKMRLYMRDGRIPLAWRIDVPERCVEEWTPGNPHEPTRIWRGEQTFEFEGVIFAVSEIPAL
jgi:Uma2 family endonuclease